MTKRLLYTVATLAILGVVPWIDTLVLTQGKAVTFIVLAGLALTLWVSGCANALERKDQ